MSFLNVHCKNTIHYLKLKLIDRLFKLILSFVPFFVCFSLIAKENGEFGHSTFAVNIQDSIVKGNKDSLLKAISPFLRSNPDTINGKDTTTLRKEITTPSKDTVKTQDNGLNSPIFTNADDSTRTDFTNNILYLYGNAKIKFEDFELTADFIRVDRNNNLMFASGAYDHNKRYRGRPIFKSKTDPPTTTDSLYYNFQTKKGKTFGTFSEVDGGFIQARQLKNNQYNEAFIKDAIYSTCNLPEPHTHFGIHITRGIVSEKNIVSGPAYLVIEDVPLPFIAIPFGFFPKTNKRASGFLFPTFGEDYSRGFFMRDIGWYFGFNDYWDTEVKGTLYSKGSYDLASRTRYLRKYKYDGGFSLRYARTQNGIEGTPGYKPTQDFNITWNHSQRQEANPGTNFSASVNVGTGSYFSNTAAGGSYDYDQITRNSMSSSISYGKVFGDGRFNFTSSLSHRQDITAGTIYLELPSFNLNMTSFNPFDTKDRIGDQKWFQRINVGYSLQGRNSIDTKEDLLFKKESLKDFRNGMQHNIPISLSLNILNYFQFNTSVNYTERWYLQSIRKGIDNSPDGFTTIMDTVQGFNRAYNYSVSSGFSTKLYGQKNFKGKLAAIRHVITPSANFNYTPDFSDDRFGFYRRFIDLNGRENVYSIFEGAVFGGPGRGESMGIGFSVDNNIEAKIRTNDSTSTDGFKKIQLIQGLSINGNYNFVADSFKLSTLSFSGRTALFNQKMGINFNGTLDPYVFDKETNRRVNRYAIKDGKLFRLTGFGLSTDYSFNSTAAKSRNDNLNKLDEDKVNMTPQQREQLNRISSDPNAFVDFNVPWNLSASFSFYYSNSGNQSSVTSTLNLSGSLTLTPKWQIQYNSGYDFRAKKVSLTQFNIYRDLHCWDMSFGYIPFGPYRSYTFTLKVKASILQDLKMSKRNDYYNSF